MITTSANYKTAIKAVSREIRAYLKFNGSTIYRGVDGLVSINWNAQLFDKERFCVNCANAAYIEAEMYGEPIQNLESAYVEAYIGVVLEYKSAKPSGSIEDDTADVEYVKLGRFDVTEVVRKNGKVMISAYDRMAKLSENYVTTVTPTDDGYSKSAIVTDIKNQCGLTWAQSFSGYVPEIVNSTMRDQLCWLYGSTTSTGQSLMLSRDGTTVISKVIVGQTALNYTIDESTTYLDGLNNQPSFTITSYTANAGENTYSYGSGAGVECYNPYITSTIASNTYNFIKNFSYTPMTLEFRGDPAIELGDILTVTSGNNSYSVVVMKMATVFNGGLKTTIYCYGNTEEWDAISNSPTGARIIQTENMVRIEAARASEAEGELAASITTTANEILSTVSANAAVVNLLPSVYFREYASGKTWTNNGITWTVNPDGSITATGTATENSDYFLTQTNDTDVPRLIVDHTKKYTFSGVPNVSGTQMRVVVYNSSGTQVDTLVIGYGTAPGVSRTIPEGYYKYAPLLRVTSGTALPSGGATWYPMLVIGDTVHAYVSTHSGSYAMESQIKQNADEIELKVSEEDVTGNYVIGKINLSSTTATIAAEHINLQGAVSISSLTNAAQAALVTNTAVKNQYYISTSSSSATGGTWADTTVAWSSGKYVWTRVVTTKTYADGTSTTTNGTAVYDANLTTSLSTGAMAMANTPIINLLPSVYRREATSGSTWTYNGITWVVNADGSVTASGTATGISDYNLSYADASSPVPWIPIDTTKKHTISGAPNTAGCYIRVVLYSQSGIGQNTYETTTSTVIPAGQYYRNAYVYLRITSGTAIPNGVTFYPMLEVGDVAHAYVSTHSGSGAIMAAAIASTVSCYYRSTTSTTPTISTSTSIGTAADTSNAWEYVMPYPKKNAYFFTCEKYTHADGSVSFSTVRSLSNADYTSKWCSSSDSTYIDGGNIYTGTVNANAIKANETFTQTLYAQDFRITGGSVNITTSSSTNDAIVLTYSIASATRTINLNAYTGVSVGYTDSSYSNVAELSHNGLSLKYNSGTYSDYYSNLTTDNIIIGNKSDRRLYATYNAIKFEKDPSNTGTVNGSITLQSYTSGGTLTFGTGDGGTLAINAYTGNMGMSMAYGSGESCTMSPSGGLVFKNSSNAVTATYGASDSSITGQYKSAKSPGAVSIAPSVAAFLSQTGANQTNIFMAHNTSTNNGIALGVGSGGVNRGILDYKAGADNGWLIYFNGTNIYLNKPTSAVSTFRIANSNQYPSIVFKSADGKSGAYSQIFSDGASVNGIYETRNISFRNYSYNASTGAISSYYEQFSLPTVTTGLTALKYYNILTTKVTGALTESDPTTTTALANNTYKSCGSVSLAAGTWLVMVEAQFSANATGTRYLIPSYTADSSSTAVHWSAEAIMPAVTASGYATAVKSTFVAHPTATSTVYFNCWQNSGSSLNVKIRYQIMRII